MHALMERKQDGFQQLRIPMAELKKARVGDDEIAYHGKMYDVKAMTLSGDIAVLTVLSDTDEDAIRDEISKLTNTEKQHGKTINHLLKLLELTYLPAIHELPTCVVGWESYLYKSYYSSLLSLTDKVLSPPPKMA
jgi:hypothetical protein